MVVHLLLTGELGSDLNELCSAFNAFQKLELLDLRGNVANSEKYAIVTPVVTLRQPISFCVSVADNRLGCHAATQLTCVLPDNCRLRVITCKWYWEVECVCVCVCVMTR